MSRDPFHAGEVTVQERTGERARAILNSRGIGHLIPPRARPFVAEQQYCVIASLSPAGRVQASFVGGERGFASSDTEGSSLTLRLPAHAVETLAAPLPGLQPGGQVGVLFIELTTRRRLRVNGRIADATADTVRVQVEEAFPNCPKYIQRREAVAVTPRVDPPAQAERGTTLTPAVIEWIRSADTFFVASAHPQGRVDVSHRGGEPGFVKVEGRRLWVPDYPGNSMFGTLGNFAVNPRAALVFPDFAGHRQLQVWGEVGLALDGGEERGATGGTGRWWSLTAGEWAVSPLTPALQWTLIDRSPLNPPAS
ncbi:MAG TPA: pyridoxamine 5'-phosphate oxidase family protein [Vicinamibacterales bacterium]|nr:pyridoxamine 5'-phosphate oxidase family protein [Vicinamibacterales bacterium]